VTEPTVWHRVDRMLARVRVHRRPLSLLIDGVVIALCWHATYLFRLGFERWWRDRPAYDVWVMLAVIAAYLSVFVIAGIPRGMWRFSGFGEVKRLTLACTASGLLCAVGVMMAQLTQVPRAVLALHPFVTLIGLCLVRACSYSMR
jgi:FlaA1/EpsC-like NDP-sugar epimerase